MSAFSKSQRLKTVERKRAIKKICWSLDELTLTSPAAPSIYIYIQQRVKGHLKSRFMCSSLYACIAFAMILNRIRVTYVRQFMFLLLLFSDSHFPLWFDAATRRLHYQRDKMSSPLKRYTI